MNKQINIYCDGGVIGSNPSLIGGTYAYIFIEGDDKRRLSSAGFVSPADMKIESITNNLTELLAAVKALRTYKRWTRKTMISFDKIVLCTDSRITKIRLENGEKFKGIPDKLREQCLKIREELSYKVVLLAGHPTDKELRKGFAKRNGNPVSKWNCWCDRKCNELKKQYE